MAKKTKMYNYKKKDTIISLFNEGQSYYRDYLELKDGNPKEAQGKLNTAGNKIQQSYELGLKCYLNGRYKELYDENKLTWQEYSSLVHTIENGHQTNKALVDLKYLITQMDLYAFPERKNTTINFELIKKNINPIYNANKHSGNDVDETLFKDSMAEIRKFILVYIDSNPPINVTQSTEYMNLMEECDFWEYPGNYNYCLICDRMDMDDVARRRLLYINWSLIIDFDEDTENDGLKQSYSNEYASQPNSFDVVNPKKTTFNNASSAPYWLHANGVRDIKESCVDSDRRWNQKYGAIIMDLLRNYRTFFTKPLKLIILGGPAQRIEQILVAMDSVYEDDWFIYLLSNEVQYEPLKEKYQDILKYFPVSAYELSQGNNSFSSFFQRKTFGAGIYVWGKEGKIPVQLEEYSTFEIPYLGVEEDENDELAQNCEFFYQGGRALSWYGAKNGFAIQRITLYRKIRNEITAASEDTRSRIIRLWHDPGAGGTTLSRTLAFDLSKEMPVMLLVSYNEKITPAQVINFYHNVGMSILIIVESAVISDDDLQRFNGELMSNTVPHVFLYVSRMRRGHHTSDRDLRYLKDDEFEEMYEKLQPYLDEKRKLDVRKLMQRPNDRYPFLVSMYAFDKDFKGLDAYIEHFLRESSNYDRRNLEYISLVDRFANRPLDRSFFRGDDLFENELNEMLIVKTVIGHNTYLKMRHPRFAETLIEQCISKESQGDKLAKAKNMSMLLIDFIHYSKQNLMYDLDSTIDILKNLLILRDTESMVRNRFAPVIQYISDELMPSDANENEKYNCIGLVFKELVETYPEEAHFKAHLSRYYSNIEKNYEKGIQEAETAVKLAEEQGKYDVLLYHIFGMSIRRYVEQKLFVRAEECMAFGEKNQLEESLSIIREQLDLASVQFEKIRETNNKVAGYISDIEMCIAVIDFGKKLYNKNTEEFLNQFKDSWMMAYYDRALTLLEGFRTMQVEEETDFYKVRLQHKCQESLQDMTYGIEATVTMWQDYLKRAENLQKPVVRRFIARAKEKQCAGSRSENNNVTKEILQLMEENIKEEPNNGANIRIWFNALRHLDEGDEDIQLDNALQKLASWKEIGDSLEAYYYYFILVCIKAIENSSRAEALIPELEDQLKAKSAHMPNNSVIYEWLGTGKGVHRLISAYENEDGSYHRKSLESIEKSACYLEGRISKYKSDRSAQIRAYNMEIFFTPLGQINCATPEDVSKRVSFVLGFSYDGLRALNKSVQIINGSNEEISSEENLTGKRVRCHITGRTDDGNCLKVKLLDYRNSFGSIRDRDLPEGKSVYDFEVGGTEVIYGEVIEKSKEASGCAFYRITLKERELDDWQKKLRNIPLG